MSNNKNAAEKAVINEEADQAISNATPTPSLAWEEGEDSSDTIVAPETEQANTADSSSVSDHTHEAANLAGSEDQAPPVPKVIVFPYVEGKRRASNGRNLAVAPENAAKGDASNGAEWSVAQTHKDSPKSQQYGVNLRAAMDVFGLKEFERGILVYIEIGIGKQRFQMTGRASRKSAAYFRASNFKAAGIALHTPFNVVILCAEPESFDEL